MNNDEVDSTSADTVPITVRVISDRNDLATAETDRSIRSVHIAFRPSGEDIILVRRKFPNLQLVHLPQSYRATLAKVVEMYLVDQNIILIMGDVWGHRKDLSTWATVNIKKSDIENAREKFNKLL